MHFPLAPNMIGVLPTALPNALPVAGVAAGLVLVSANRAAESRGGAPGGMQNLVDRC